MKKILALAYGGGHINMLIPIVKALKQRSSDVRLIALTGACVAAQDAQLPYTAYQDYLSLLGERRAEAIELGKTLAVCQHNPESGIPVEESVAYLGVNFMGLCDDYGPETAKILFQKIGRHAFLPVAFMRTILESLQPDLVLTTNSPRSERAGIIAAMQLGIPSVFLEDLFFYPELPLRLQQELGDDSALLKHFAIKPSKIAVMCSYAKEKYADNAHILEIATPREDVIVTGQPIFDELDDLMQTTPQYSLIPGRQDQITLCWAHQNGTPDEAAVYELLSEWLHHSGQSYNFIIKIHPNLMPDDVQALKRKFGLEGQLPNVLCIQREMAANPIVWNSDCLISQDSTMLAQASYLGKPLLILDPLSCRQDSIYVQKGAARFIKTPEDLALALSETQRLQANRSNPLGFVQNGTRNIADLIDSLI